MADIVGYQEWLRSLQRHVSHSFLNNYWCAMLAQDMDETKQSEIFKIPYFIVEEELMREDDNVNLENNDGSYVSAALRHWLVHLLKPYDEKVNARNVDNVLRSFIHNQMSLPPGVVIPLNTSTFFHNLPTECKLWTIYMVKNHKKPSRPLQRVATDSMGNEYCIVPDCRLYVKIPAEKATLPIDEAILKGQQWESLYRYVHAQQWILLSENQEEWKVVSNALQFCFNLNDVHYSLLPRISVKLTSQSLSNMMQEKARREFSSQLNILGPIPSIELWEKKVNTNNQKKKKAEDNDVNALKNDLESVNVKDFIHPSSPTAISSIKNSNEPLGKCWNFPKCPLGKRCKYIHPQLPCTKFPINKCKLGWRCFFLHTQCPKDGHCEAPHCAFEHWESIPTYYRAPRGEDQNNKPRPVASVTPIVRKVSDQPIKTHEHASKAPASGQSAPSPQEPKRRCGFFPRCDRVHTVDNFFHPIEKCKKLAAGQQCDGQRCLFLHGVCSSDGFCVDQRCIFEHHKSPTVLERVLARKKEGSLSRTPSMTNLSRIHSMSNASLCSSRAGGRRKSVTFDFDTDEQCDVEKKSSSTTVPAGILRPMGMNSKGRCRFRAQCTNMECEYMHPREKCPEFPKCPFGGNCYYKHETCKSDGVCVNENCNFEHILRRPTTKYWCNDGAQCKRINCKFIHPKECIGRCPKPGNCWMYHRPTKDVTATTRPTPPAAAAATRHTPPAAAAASRTAAAATTRPTPPEAAAASRTAAAAATRPTPTATSRPTTAAATAANRATPPAAAAANKPTAAAAAAAPQSPQVPPRTNPLAQPPASPGPVPKPRTTAPPSSPQQTVRGQVSSTPSTPDYAGAPLHRQPADMMHGNGANYGPHSGYYPGANGYGPAPGMGPGGYGHPGFQPGPYGPYPGYHPGYDYGHGMGYGNMPGYGPPQHPYPQPAPPPSYTEAEQRFLDSKSRP